MNKLYIPELGSKIILTKDWKFNLVYEYRNLSLYDKLNLQKNNHDVIIPKDTVLSIQRIYIRKGASQYSSITFGITKQDNKNNILAGAKFFASLIDVNNIEYKLPENNEVLYTELKEAFKKIKIELDDVNTYKFY